MTKFYVALAPPNSMHVIRVLLLLSPTDSVQANTTQSRYFLIQAPLVLPHTFCCAFGMISTASPQLYDTKAQSFRSKSGLSRIRCGRPWFHSTAGSRRLRQYWCTSELQTAVLWHIRDRESPKRFHLLIFLGRSGSGIRRWLAPEGGWC